MKAVALGVVLLVVVAAGATTAYVLLESDGTAGDTRASYAASLAGLCVETRTQIEALGRPSDTPIDVVYPGTVRIGRAFVTRARALTPPPGQRKRAAELVHQYALYYDGLQYAYGYLTRERNQVAFVRIVNGALANLRNAEAAARVLGAPECAVRPFE